MKVNNKNKAYSLVINYEQSMILKDALEKVKDDHASSAIYDSLVKNVNTIVTVWERNMKNDKIVERAKKAAAEWNKKK